MSSDTTLINANEAYNIASQYISSKDNAQLEEIANLISEQCNKGRMYINYYNNISNTVLNILHNANYTITDCTSQRDGKNYIIEWDMENNSELDDTE